MERGRIQCGSQELARQIAPNTKNPLEFLKVAITVESASALGWHHPADLPSFLRSLFSCALTPSESSSVDGERVKGIFFISTKRFMGNPEIAQDLVDKILELETRLRERDDALGLAAHLQAIAYRR